MELPLVVGVDGSEFGLRAVDWATEEAARYGLPLRLVHASLWQRYEQPGNTPSSGNIPTSPARSPAESEAWQASGGDTGGRQIGEAAVPETWETGAAGAEFGQPEVSGAPGRPQAATRPEACPRAQDIVECAAERAALRNPDVKVLTEVVCEETEDALLREARNATALVVGERGCGAVPGLLLGSVALAMAVRAPCPVIVVRGSARNRGDVHRRVLLAAGEAASGAGAVLFAFREATMRHSELLALRAWRCPASQTAGRLRWPEDRVRRHEQRAAQLLDDVLRPAERAFPQTDVVRAVVEGPAHEVLLARSQRADLLVTGARRHRRHLGAQIGRVAHTMLHYADCPVAVVPHRG
ncbi:universal stress protein [Streptomyces odontomachi]|uniref:universal stress protein n=1 Tax=Streptomyces odontomachi TaxID=2944940 RepID=UPI00210A954D|nr:universal stress protein [Streptomyces sp. ODS25]